MILNHVIGAFCGLAGMAGGVMANTGPYDFIRRTAPYLIAINFVLFWLHLTQLLLELWSRL